MTVKEWKKERTRQTCRLYTLLKHPGKEGLDKEILDCIQKGADLKRRIQFRKGLPIWHAIGMAHDTSVVKILYEYGGLGDDIIIPNQYTYSSSSRHMKYTHTLEWTISEIYNKLTYPDEYKNDNNYKEYVEWIERRKRLYEEYKTIFDIEKFDLKHLEKKGYYDSVEEWLKSY